MDPNYGIEIVRITESAAISAARQQGFGDEQALLNDARKVMVKIMNNQRFNMHVINDRFNNINAIVPFPEVINNREENNFFEMIIAAVDGHKVTANGGPNAASFIALGIKDAFMKFPNVYMNKIAVGPDAFGVVDIETSVSNNVKKVARALKKYIDNITVVFLDRQRNAKLIEEVRSCGARIQLIQDGDISAALASVFSGKVDMVAGYGGAQEGVLTAAFMKCIGGDITGKLYVQNEEDSEKISKAGISDINRIYQIDDLVTNNDISVACTGVSDGYFLDGVKFDRSGARTHSFIARGLTKTFRDIRTRQLFDYKELF